MYRSNVQNQGIPDSNGNYDLVYYNADIINSNPTNTISTSDPVVSFQETRNTPILTNSREYEFSIVRFQVNGCGRNLPLFIPNVLIGVQNPSLYNDFVLSPLDGKYYLLILINPASSIDPSLDPTHWQLFDFIGTPPQTNAPFVYQNTQVLLYQGLWVNGTSYLIKPIPNTSAFANAPSNMTAYYLGLSINISGQSYYFSRNINFEPENSIQPIPSPPVVSQNVSNDYYYVYTYEHWVRLINKTLNSLFLDVQTYATNSGHPFTGYPPFMTYEASTGLFSMYYDTTLFGTSVVNVQLNDPFMQLFSNDNFYGLFSSFNFTVPLPQNFTHGQNTNTPNLFVVQNKLNSNIWKPNAFIGFPTLADSYYKMTQNYVTTSSLWSPVSSIVFTTGQLPVLNETSSAPVRFGLANNNISSIANNFTPIIADVALPIKRAEDYNNLIFYEPNGEYRMASMLGGANGVITNIDIQVFWKNRLDNRLYPLRMFNYSNVSMKMLFRKKKN